jgi:anaerobic magnesium-protoporphyrin IX monomethyl ester cyclase
MKVLLLRPPAYSKTLEYPSGPRFGLPVGLLYLAGYLEKAGVDVRIYDALIDFDWRDLKADGGAHYHLGASWPTLVSKTLEHSPDLVGITNPVSDMAEYAIRAAREIKAARTNTVTVIGGPHATSCPDDFLSGDGAVDYVVRGEGEETLARLVGTLSDGGDPKRIPGVTYMDRGRAHSNPPAPFIRELDDLPMPAYHRQRGLSDPLHVRISGKRTRGLHDHVARLPLPLRLLRQPSAYGQGLALQQR